MLDPLSAWKSRLLSMPQVNTAIEGAQNLADFIGDMSNKVQAGATGTVGIFTFDRGTFVSTLLSSGFSPVNDLSWASKLSDAWLAGCSTSTITAATVTDPSWTASNKDVLTVSTGSVTIITVSSARSTLYSGLVSAGAPYIGGGITNPSQSDAQVEKFAQAFRDAVLAFQFNCIGLAIIGEGTGAIPKVFSAL